MFFMPVAVNAFWLKFKSSSCPKLPTGLNYLVVRMILERFSAKADQKLKMATIARLS